MQVERIVSFLDTLVPAFSQWRWVGGTGPFPDEQETVQMLVVPPNEAFPVVVDGWMTRRFAIYGCPVTWWTWDPRFARVSQFVPGVTPVVLAGCVEALAWCARSSEVMQ